MALFKWFSRKSATAGKASSDAPAGGASKPEGEPLSRSETRKAQRHARREQLYLAIREAMTRGGVLSSGYKFKVLSLDQRGNRFLVMIDINQALGRQPEKLSAIEAIIMQSTLARYDIEVTSVYWRLDAAAPVAARADLPVSPQPNSAAESERASPQIKTPAPSRFEEIHAEEVIAFKQALAAASASHPVHVDASGKSRSGPHSYTLLTGFEDTEMPESAAGPALSSTQYGDLN